MKLIALISEAAVDAALLEREYEAGEDYAPAKLGTERLFFKSGRKVYHIPYTAITRCFRRVELVNARMGCCNQGLPMESVVICGPEETELAQIRLTSERLGKALLDALAARCPQAQIGYVRPPEQDSAVRYV